MKKKNLFNIILISLNLLCVFLLIFLVPEKIPLFVDFNEKVTVLGSKWWILLTFIFPIILLILWLKNKDENTGLILTSFNVLYTYMSFVVYTALCTTSFFETNTHLPIPLSLVIFLPISLFTLIYGAKIKHIPYKHTLGVRTKNTTKTEFIWLQSHIFANLFFMFAGLVQFIITIIFTFVKLPLIEAILFLISYPLAILATNKQAKDMVYKYDKLKKNKDRQDELKKVKEELEKEVEKEKEKTENSKNKTNA